nr:GGDEF domain-containing protein [Pseudofrankia sp. DC12]
MVRLRSVLGVTSAPWRSTGAGWTPRLLRYAVAICVLLVGLAVAFAVLLEPRHGLIGTNLVDAIAQGAALAACLWTARRVCGAERRWRVLIGIQAGGGLLGSLLFVLMLQAGADVSGHIGRGYAFFLVNYAVALAGLLSLPTESMGGHSGAYRWYAITLLDCALVVGSLALLEWGTALGALVRADVPNLTQFVLALAYPVGGLVLATAVVLIASFRRPRSPAALGFLGLGLLASGITSNIFVYSVAHGRTELPPWLLIGFIIAFLLMFLAVLVPVPAASRPDRLVSPSARAMWMHAMLPYGVLCAAGALAVGKLLGGVGLDRFETYGMVGLLLVALVRQIVTLRENTQLLAAVRKRERQLHHQAFHDPLTGLANRAMFTRQLGRALEHDRGDLDNVDGPRPLSVLFLDLDEFKQVNDTFGHAVGDELLKISAKRLRAGTRPTDTVARLGGDEFAIILAGCGPVDPRMVGERLAAAIQAPCPLAGRPYAPRASLGLVTLDPANLPASPDILLHQADLAMYAAKRERAGRLVVYRPELALPTATAPTPSSPGSPGGASRR